MLLTQQSLFRRFDYLAIFNTTIKIYIIRLENSLNINFCPLDTFPYLWLIQMVFHATGSFNKVFIFRHSPFTAPLLFVQLAAIKLPNITELVKYCQLVSRRYVNFSYFQFSIAQYVLISRYIWKINKITRNDRYLFRDSFLIYRVRTSYFSQNVNWNRIE